MTAPVRSPTGRVILYALIVAVAYAALSQTVNSLSALGSSEGSTLWPGAGLTLGVLLSRPRREWPWYLGAVFLAETLMDVKLGSALGLSLEWGVSNTVEPLLGAWLLTRGRQPAPDIGRRHDLVRFFLLGAVAGPALGALVGTAGGVLLAGDHWWPRLGRWFVGDGVGALAVAPAVLMLASGVRPRRTPGLVGGGVLMLAVTAVAASPWAFSGDLGLPFLIIPALVFYAVRCGTAGASVGLLIVSLWISGVGAAGKGPFEYAGALNGLIIAQMFTVMAALTALTMAALMRDLVSRDQVQKLLEDQALHDNLTGLANRKLLADRLDHASRRLARQQGRIGLLFIDLDSFKEVNDTLGHASGDVVLLEVARRLSAIVRDHDTVARIGGDEFLVLVDDLENVAQAEQLAQRAITALSVSVPCPDGIARIRASVGLAIADEPFADAELFLRAADRAMYAAKQAGGDRFRTAPDDWADLRRAPPAAGPLAGSPG
jgi:diguanylate cyclase (GGDEF)-like protein